MHVTSCWRVGFAWRGTPGRTCDRGSMPDICMHCGSSSHESYKPPWFSMRSRCSELRRPPRPPPLHGLPRPQGPLRPQSLRRATRWVAAIAQRHPGLPRLDGLRRPGGLRRPRGLRRPHGVRRPDVAATSGVAASRWVVVPSRPAPTALNAATRWLAA